MIANQHGKRVLLIKGFTIPLKILGNLTGVVNKAFGNLAYDYKLSSYKQDYQLYSLKESIARTEE